MATRKVEIGATGRTVAANITRCRKKQGCTMRELATRLEGAHWPLSASAISQIENGARRVDADDLVAMSVALGVSPITLLMPATPTGDEVVHSTGVNEATAHEIWQWMRTELPIGGDVRQITENLEFQWRAKPSWLHAEIAERGNGERATPETIQAVADEMKRRLATNGDD